MNLFNILKMNEFPETTRCRYCDRGYDNLTKLKTSFCGHKLCEECYNEAEIRGKCLVCPNIARLVKTIKKFEKNKNKKELEKPETTEPEEKQEQEQEQEIKRRIELNLKCQEDREVFELFLQKNRII